ncbi:MAG: peptidase domain-containing ABC transporter [Rhodoferax sp.]|nr:peptidase domain-containing ABC transporter [Rhodoferax sp.]
MSLVLQLESSECGLACLAMLAAHFGQNIRMEDLRAKFDVSTRGTSLGDLARMADQIGMHARCLELSADDIGQLRLPAILHWDGNHWVVLKKVSAKGIHLNDPAQGERWVSWNEVKSRFSGFAADFLPRAKIIRTPPQPRLQFMALLSSFPGLMGAVLQLMAMSVVLEIIALLTPYYTQLVMDHVLVNGDLDLLNILALGTVFLLLFQTLFTALRGWAGVVLAQSVGYQLYAHVIRHMFSLPMTFFVRRQVGDMVSRFDSLGQIAQSLTRTSMEVILDVLVSIGTVVMMYVYSPTLAMIGLATFALMLIVKLVVFSSSLQVVAERTFLHARCQSHLIESLRGMHAVKMGQAELLRTQQWTTQTRQVMERDLATERINLGSTLVMTITTGMAHTSVVFFAAQMILANQLSVGMLFAFMAYQGNFAARASAFVDRVLWFRTMNVHFGRVGDIVFATPETAPPIQNAASHPAKTWLRTEGIAYRYSAADPWVFGQLSFEVQAGEVVAVVGPSGSGKTTLLCVLGGIFLPSAGKLFYDGLEVKPDNTTALRQRVAFVFQNDELFEGSLEENISFFAAQADRKQIKRCAELACIAGDIALFPQGYRTRLAEQGAGLSGGQRQRILIARALYLQPSLLVLDEATSHLDVQTERQILQNLKGLNITIVMSAHRPDAIALADRVYALHTHSWLRG